MAGQSRLSLVRSKDNIKAFLWLRKFIRLIHHALNCQQLVSAFLKRLRIDAIDPMLIHAAGQTTTEFRGIRPDAFLTRMMTAAWRRERVGFDGQKSDSQAGEHRGIFGDERSQLRMRGFELFNGLF